MRLPKVVALLAGLLWLQPGTVPASDLDPELLARMEASMLLTGTIDIEVDGTVSGYEIDHADAVPDYVIDLIDDNVPEWRFEPVQQDGRPARARGPMNLRLLATPVGEGGLAVSIKGASFGDDESVPKARRLAPPSYPGDLLSSGVQGDAYLLLKVDMEGAVKEVVVEQVSLRSPATGRKAEYYRRQLGDVSRKAARRWRWEATAPGDSPERGYWRFRMPVSFSIAGVYQPTYGQWQPYLPGERNALPEWAGDAEHGAPDTLLAGKPQALGTGPRLLTPLSGG